MVHQNHPKTPPISSCQAISPDNQWLGSEIMDKIGSYLFVTGLLVFFFLMPMWVAVAVRILFRKANKRILAMITAVPFAVWLLTRDNPPNIIPDLEWENYGLIFRVVTTALVLSIVLLVNYGLPYVLAKAGVAIGDKIMKRNPNQSTHSITVSGGSE